MNSFEAYNILGLSQGASSEEIKKSFRKKAAELHPDINKAKNAEADFKKLNEAYQLLTSTKASNRTNSSYSDYFNSPMWRYVSINMNDFFGHRRSSHNKIKARIKISFEESVKGVVKTISYKRRNKCFTCNGSCFITFEDKNKKCEKCNGKGRRTYGTDDKEMPCTTCVSTGHKRSRGRCNNCDGKGSIEEQHTTVIKIPPGTLSTQYLLLKEEGDFIGAMSVYEDAKIEVTATSDPDLRLHGRDVVSNVNLSLLEALEGVTKEVRTVIGQKKLKIKPRLKNGDKIVAKGLGIPPHGNHVFVLNIEYPNDINGLIQYLKSVDGYIVDEPENKE